MVKLLIVDDESAMQEFGKPFFERRGYQVCCASNGKQGIEIFKAEKPEVVILDLGLPDIDGRDVLVKLKELNTNAKIIILSGFSEEEIKEKILPLRPDAYFAKPCKFPVIAEKIETWFK